MSHDTLIQHLNVSDLADHPLLAHIPVWRRDEPEFQALVESIRERGIDYPVLIDSERRILDGRNRRNAVALIGGLVPCLYITGDEAASVIVASLVNRRHLTKGARAYLCAPLFAHVLEESKQRQLANLKQGLVSENLLSRLSVKSAADVASQVGVSPALLDQALRLRRMFDEAAPEVRAKYEPRILGEWADEEGEWQDPVGLGYMINGLTSLLNEEAGKAKQLGKRAQHDRLFVGYLPKLKEHWKKANEAQRAQITEQLKSEVTKWPAELREEISTALRAAARADKE